MMNCHLSQFSGRLKLQLHMRSTQVITCHPGQFSLDFQTPRSIFSGPQGWTSSEVDSKDILTPSLIFSRPQGWTSSEVDS